MQKKILFKLCAFLLCLIGKSSLFAQLQGENSSVEPKDGISLANILVVKGQNLEEDLLERVPRDIKERMVLLAKGAGYGCLVGACEVIKAYVMYKAYKNITSDSITELGQIRINADLKGDSPERDQEEIAAQENNIYARILSPLFVLVLTPTITYLEYTKLLPKAIKFIKCAFRTKDTPSCQP